MVTLLYIFSLFFNVNDSIITFKNKFQKKKKTDTMLILWYPHPVKEYESGNYYYPTFVTGEINVFRNKRGALVKVHYKKDMTPFIYGDRVIFRHPQKRFYLKAKNASPEDLKRLFNSMGYKFNWLDSLKGQGYTIWGEFTESKLKWALMRNGRKDIKKVKKR